MDTRPPLIPRQHLFSNPERLFPRISPDGHYLTWLAPLEGVLNIWLAPADNPDAAHPVTRDTHRGIQSYHWAYDGRSLLYEQDRDGDENWHLHAVDIESGEDRDLTPIESVSAQVIALNERHPDTLVVGLNDRDPTLHDPYLINLTTGERTRLIENPGFQQIVVDRDFRIRLADKMEPDGSIQRFQYHQGDWHPLDRIPVEDTMSTGIIAFENDNNHLLMMDSRGRNTAALVRQNLTTGETETVLADDRADVASVLIEPVTHTLQAVAVEYQRLEWTLLDDSIKDDLAILDTMNEGQRFIRSRSLDDQHWIVEFVSPNHPSRYYHYHRAEQRADDLFSSRPVLEGVPLAPKHPVIIPTRDGLELVSYLTLPIESDPDRTGCPDSPQPMVLLVHGGPWGRDGYHPDPKALWLADRGYAVLNVNFRGSTGLGKAFVNAGDREWAGKMHDDLLDAVDWAVDRGIAQRDKVAIMGGSYGGYAVLVGLTFTPEVFACGVDLVGPANLITLLDTIPPYWTPMLEMFAQRVGDPRTEEGRAFLKERSPLTYADRISKPLLIGQGANDPRVKQQESDQIVTALKERGIPVTYALYPDEGHGFVRPENTLSFNAIVEGFLGSVLGGRVEPIGDDLNGASVRIPVGAEHLPESTRHQYITP